MFARKCHLVLSPSEIENRFRLNLGSIPGQADEPGWLGMLSPPASLSPSSCVRRGNLLCSSCSGLCTVPILPEPGQQLLLAQAHAWRPGLGDPVCETVVFSCWCGLHAYSWVGHASNSRRATWQSSPNGQPAALSGPPGGALCQVGAVPSAARLSVTGRAVLPELRYQQHASQQHGCCIVVCCG